MQKAECKTVMVNDIGLLNADQIQAFREYLVESGLLVRDSAGTGQFFHVRVPELPRWLAIERGHAGAPVTPDVLRPFVASFLKKPLDSAMGNVRAQRQAAERSVARAALALPVTVGTAPPALEPIRTVEPEQSVVMSLPEVAYMPPLAKHPAPLSRYLSDLRDDFALHAPIAAPWPVTDDNLRAHAINRWAYADMMLATRTTKAGD